MADIARITFNSSTDFYEVMDMLDKRLNDKGKNWRHVLKSLKVLDYCLHEGSELVVTWARKNIYIIKTLREFIYLDEDNRDVGASSEYNQRCYLMLVLTTTLVRHSAKELTSLILDEERLRAERTNRGAWKSRVTGLDEVPGGMDSRSTRPRNRQQRHDSDEDDVEYKLALEASKNEAADAAERKKRSTAPDNDDDLAKAIRLSKEEEDSRKRELEDQNQANLLFDDTPVQTQPTGFNQGYQQQAAVDWFGNPVQQQQPQQPQQTGYLNNVYNVPQQTGFQNGYTGGYGYQQPQMTGLSPTQQAQPIQPQQTYNPWAQQMQQQPIQEQPTATTGSNNPWASTTSTQSPLAIQPTGSNNPFATQRPQTTTPISRAPTLQTLQEQQTAQFQPRPNPIANFAVPQQQPQQSPIQQKPQDPYTARLNALLATGDGQDTFGNVGETRIPAQHTAPGTFVNSAGAGSMGRLEAAKTGNNPFFSQQPSSLSTQYTGMPSMQYPAQTGPAFGARPGQQQQSGSLIDF